MAAIYIILGPWKHFYLVCLLPLFSFPLSWDSTSAVSCTYRDKVDDSWIWSKIIKKVKKEFENALKLLRITVLQFRLKAIMTRQHTFPLKCIKSYRSIASNGVMVQHKLTKYVLSTKYQVNGIAITWEGSASTWSFLQGGSSSPWGKLHFTVVSVPNWAPLKTTGWI